MDSRVAMSPVCSDQGTARVIKDPTSVPPSRLPPRAAASPLHGGRRSRRRGDRASICEELDIGHMASLDPAPSGESSLLIRLWMLEGLADLGQRASPGRSANLGADEASVFHSRCRPELMISGWPPPEAAAGPKSFVRALSQYSCPAATRTARSPAGTGCPPGRRTR
jgi:hypothetical protein